MGSKGRKPRRGGVSRSTLARRFHSDLVHVTQKADPYTKRQYRRRVDSLARDITAPLRKQVEVDYFPSPTPLKTEPQREVDRKKSILAMDPDFIDGLDTYHKIKIIDEPTYKLSLFFHANHCYFISQDFILNKAYMSQDFNDRKRALYVYRIGGLLWPQEVSVNDHRV